MKKKKRPDNYNLIGSSLKDKITDFHRPLSLNKIRHLKLNYENNSSIP